MERRFTPHAITLTRIDSDGDAPSSIAGVAAVFYDGSEATEFGLWDGAVERIMPGAFDRVLKDNDDARALFNHDPDNLLGRRSAGTLSLRASKAGLEYEIPIADTTIARDVVAHIERGDLTGSSFAFNVSSETWRKDEDRGIEIREINEVGSLFDVGPVTYPAYETTTTGLRAAGGVDDARAARDSWRQREAHAARCGRIKRVRARMVEVGLDT